MAARRHGEWRLGGDAAHGVLAILEAGLTLLAYADNNHFVRRVVVSIKSDVPGVPARDWQLAQPFTYRTADETPGQSMQTVLRARGAIGFAIGQEAYARR